jgi:GT2 family glycosyltransferase
MPQGSMAIESLTQQSPAVAVILVNWNGWRDAIECVDSLLAQAYANYHIFVVDNGSSDGSIEQLCAWCASPGRELKWSYFAGVEGIAGSAHRVPVGCRVTEPTDTTLPTAAAGCRLTLIRAGRNLGFAGGCNVGIRAAGLEQFAFFWLLNPDTVVHPGALTELVRRAGSDDRIGIVGSTIRYYHEPHIVQSLGGARMDLSTVTSHLIGQGSPIEAIPRDPSEVEREMAYVMGASMLVSREFIREVGFLQEDYFLYYEEIDWAMRGRQKFKLAYAPASHVYHKSGASSSKIMPLYTLDLYYRNRLRFVSRFLPERMPGAKRGLAMDLLRHTLKGRWRQARIAGTVLWQASRIIGTANPVRSAPAARGVPSKQ